MYSYIFSSVILLFFFFNGSVGLAQDINLRVNHLTADDGLSENHVDCIHKDSRGFMWFGTWDGLNRFDGYELKIYRADDNNGSLSSSIINDMVEDESGNLWIATREGLNKFIFEENRFISFLRDTSGENSISDNWIKTLMFDQHGQLWIGTANAGVDKIVFDSTKTNIQSVTHYPAFNFENNRSLTHFNIYSLMEDKEGQIWIGSLLGLDKLDPETGIVTKFTDPEHPMFFAPTVVHSLHQDKNNVVWVGTENGAIKLDCDAQEQSIYRSNPDDPKALNHPIVRDINEDINGKLLFGTLRGLYSYNPGTDDFTKLLSEGEDDFSLNGEFINQLYCDELGMVWIGMDNSGINRYNTNQKKFYYLPSQQEHPVDINQTIVNSIWKGEKYLWIGSAGQGLLAYDLQNNSIQQFERDPDDRTTISTNYISGLASIKENVIWAGTWGRGLNKITVQGDDIRIKQLHHVDESMGLPFVYISSMLFDKKGRLYLGQPTGIEILDTQTEQFYMLQLPEYGPQITDVASLFIDNDNIFWVGSTNGLFRFRLNENASIEQLIIPDTVYHYQHNPNDQNSLPGNHVVDIHQDKTGQMWFSVYGNGLCKLEELSNDGNSARFSKQIIGEIRSNNVIYGILEDDKHNLWLSTDRGLTKYNYKDSTSHRYFETDGLQSNQFYWSAFHKGNDGYLYFGGTQGLNYFHPDSIQHSQYSPPVVITDFQLFNKTVSVNPTEKGQLKKAISVAETIHLKYEENIISFEFAALGYDLQEKIMYKYKMEGFEDSWTYTDADRRYVTYTNLNPGEYVFHVNATNKDGIWNEAGTTVKIVIRPPWWKTGWFIAGTILFLIMLLYVMYKWRVRALKNQKVQLEQLVAERTAEINMANKELKELNATKDKFFTIIAHDLKSPFNSLLGMSEILSEKYDKYTDDKRKMLVRTIFQSANNIYKLLENLLQWSRAQTGNITVEPTQFNLKELIDSNIHVLDNLIEEKNIEIVNDVKGDNQVYADKNLISTVIRNLLSNAIKFTENGRIHIYSSITDSCITVCIEDNGTGIPQDQMENIFNIGKSVSVRGTRGESGSGLGLVLCREFVEKNGGNISAESQEDEGSVFCFTIPLGEN